MGVRKEKERCLEEDGYVGNQWKNRRMISFMIYLLLSLPFPHSSPSRSLIRVVFLQLWLSPSKKY